MTNLVGGAKDFGMELPLHSQLSVFDEVVVKIEIANDSLDGIWVILFELNDLLIPLNERAV